ncbi:NAD-dependent epimerase/dehydratase family protein [Microbacterium ulmi]|uniref:UDP-glucose 4-epimerase n=1 Tax=Microbacterium ulmi TaxID=179095 RepID=A0A7Y2Q0R5_9MICO|nr:NAD(P)-dependent oxidoreductase [Microbacterium ulmi]NII69048.1 nucleoside-diphosphate-sugar epimerase [Microbacterium ulmi]NNH04628.1 NAD(P)-dependent oxidoreductase [Microbacterium ulmi]
MSRFLVTGGAGRLGRSVVQALAEAGHDVVSVDRVQAAGLPARQVVHDLRDAESTAELFAEHRPDAVVHLAGIAVPFSAPDDVTFQTNTSLSLAVLTAARETGVGAVLISSSPTVIGYGAPSGWEPTALPIDEEHPLAPWNAYALAKVAIEELVQSVVRADTPLRVGVFRPCYVVSPEEWLGAATQQGHTIRERLDDPALAAVSLFNYIDARDAGDFVLAWLTQPDAAPNGSVFFVAAADSLVREPVGDALARHVPATARLAASLPPTAPVFSSAKAERLLGWRARRSWRTELADAETVSTHAGGKGIDE